MKRTLVSSVVKVGLLVGGVAAAAMIVFGGGAAIAERVVSGAGPRGMQRRVHAFIAGAVDAARPDAVQRRALEGVRDRVMSQMKGIHGARAADAREALGLFEADALDSARVAAIKSARLSEMNRAGDAVVSALTEVHDVLRPEQRKAVADYLRAHKPSKGPGVRGQMMKRFASARLDDMLDEVDATDTQREAIEAARDHVFAALDENLGDTQAQLAERALALFQADRIDQAQVQAMRAEHQVKAGRIADAAVQALHDVHDALTPAQRKEATDELRRRMARFGGRHHRGGGGSGGPRPAGGPMDTSGE